MNQKPNIANLILAAGGSTRMSSPKQLLPWKGSFLLNHAITIANKIENVTTFVVLGAYFKDIHSKLDRTKIKIIHNQKWKNGLGHSIATGVAFIKNQPIAYDGILIMLADQPLITADFMNQVIRLFEPNKKQIIASSYENNTMGVPALFDVAYSDELQNLNKDMGAKRLIHDHKNQVITIDAKEFISDIDTLEDYQRLYTANHQ